MKKLTIFLLVLLLCVLVAFSYFFVSDQSSLAFPKNLLPTPTPVSQSTLRITPETIIASPVKTTANITLQNTYAAPKLVQLEIAYDPLSIINMRITPGDFFTNPIILFSRINENTGRISYVLQDNSPEQLIKPDGAVAILSFSPSLSPLTSSTELEFLPKTIVKAANGSNMLNGTYGATVQFNKETINTITPIIPPGELNTQTTFEPTP